MDIKIAYRHMDSTAALEESTRTKCLKLEKYFKGEFHLDWNFSVEKLQQIAHCHMTGSHIDFFAEASTDSAYKSVEEVIAHLERQIKQKKEILKDHHIQAKSAAKITTNLVE